MTIANPWPLHTARLTLRHPSTADLRAAFAFRNLESVNRYMVRNVVTFDDFCTDFDLASPTAFSSVAALNDEVIGIAFLDVCTPAGDPGAPVNNEAIIGYMLAPAFWGNGFGSDIADALVRVCRERLHVRRIMAFCHKENVASPKVLERAGLAREGHSIAAYYSGELGWQDGYAYGLLTDPAEEPERPPLAPMPDTPGRLMPGDSDWPTVTFTPTFDRAETISWPTGETQNFTARAVNIHLGECSITVQPGIGHDDTPADGMNAELTFPTTDTWLSQANSATGAAVVSALAHKAFEHPGVRRITADARVHHTATGAALTAAGFRLSRYRFRDFWDADRGFVDSATYELLR